MREIVSDIARWFEEGSEVALAQVIKTWGSSPRKVGSIMAVSSAGKIAGSVSGGCIEGAVVQSAMECLERGGEARVEQFRASNTAARAVGLSCGGDITVLVSRLQPQLFASECELLGSDSEYVRVTVARSDNASFFGSGFLVDAATSVTDELTAEIWRLAKKQGTGLAKIKDVEYFYSYKAPKPLLVCIGGVHIAIHLTQLAKGLGYRTIVIDPRRVFSSEERFSFVDELVHSWPQEAFKNIRLNAASAVCALTHDPKIDVPALSIALDSPAFYIGSLGRYTTQLSRYKQLTKLGYADADIERIYGPIGLDIAAADPAEIALSVMAEITAVKNGKAQGTSTMLGSAKKAMLEKGSVPALV